jgi:hypothetical protein
MIMGFKELMGKRIEATDGSLGNAIRFFVDQDDWSMPLVMVGGGLATTGELMMPTRMVVEPDRKDPSLKVPNLRRDVFDTLMKDPGDHHGVFDALRLMKAGVTARGEDVGHVVDLMVDTDRPWNIRYLVVDLDAMEPGQEALFSPEWISEFDLNSKHVDLDVPPEAVRDCPTCDLREGVTRGYERRLHEHYDKPVHLARFG